MLDMTNAEHREKVRWACNQGVEHAAIRRGEDSVKGVALRALSSPSDSAALARALLEGYGVESRTWDHDMRRGGGACWVMVDVLAPVLYAIPFDKAPLLILALLDAKTRGEALAALRGAS